MKNFIKTKKRWSRPSFRRRKRIYKRGIEMYSTGMEFKRSPHFRI